VLGFASRPRERRAASSLRRRCANGSAPSARAGSAGPASPATASDRARGRLVLRAVGPSRCALGASGAGWLRLAFRSSRVGRGDAPSTNSSGAPRV